MVINMKQSNDVTKLFALFDAASADQYREVNSDEEQHKVRERWPLFKRNPLSNQPTFPLEPSVVDQGPTVQCASKTHESSQAKTAPKPAEMLSASSKPASIAEASSEGDLRTLFDRLARPEKDSVVSPPEPADDSAPVAAPSMKTLFSRLRQK